MTLNNPIAGTYEIYVDLFAVGGDGTETVPFHSWVIPGAPAGNLTVTPATASVTTGVPMTFNLTTAGSPLARGTSARSTSATARARWPAPSCASTPDLRRPTGRSGHPCSG